MRNTPLTVIAGALSRGQKPKGTQAQDAIAKRWRLGSAAVAESTTDTPTPDVIPLLDGWIRRLEREAGSSPEFESR
jgi:hypothetical protein